MWLGKKFLLKLATALAVVVPAAWGAKVAPLYFEGVEDGMQQDFWENLMKYKLWGTHKLDFNNGIISISDDVGYNGTADGDFTISNGNHHIGGPTLIGGNVSFSNSNNDTLSVGPTRILGDLQVSTAMNSDFQGNFCVQGAVSGQYGDANVRNWEGLVRGNGADIYAGDQYANCPSSVPEVDVSLKVPVWPTAGVEWEQTFEMTSCYENETKFIHVPPDSVEMNAYGTYDKYIEKFTVGCSAKKKLYVLMPPGGKLTRIFSKDGFEFSNAANDLIIQVVYVAPGTNFNKATKEWDLTNKGEFSYIGNKDYVGNLLFYTNKDIKWDYWVDASFQGSWITTGDLIVGGHFKCAGQLIGNNLLVMNNVVGDFKYVPFDPPWIDVGDPTARSWGVVKESERGPQSLKVELSKEPTTNVTFKYCFDFKGDQSYNKETDPDSTHALASLTDVVASSVPVCNGTVSTVYKTTTFLKGQVIPTQKITVEVADDHDVEWTERFSIRIFDLEGAVLQHIDEKGQITQVRSGEFYIEIEDDDDLFISKDTSVVVVEDTPYPFLKTDFPIMTPDSVVWEGDFAIRFNGSTGNAGVLTIGDKVVKQGSEISSKDIAEGKLIYTPAENVYSADGSPNDFIEYYVVRSGNQSFESYKMYFVITPVNDAPVPHPVTFTIKENVTLADPNGAGIANGSWEETAEKKKIEDADDDVFTFKFDDTFDAENTEENYKKVTSLYTIDPNTGSVAVKEGAALNYESADSLLHIRVVVTDKSASTDVADPKSGTTIITIQMIDVNEEPVVVNQEFEIKEGEAGIKVHTVGGDSTSKDDGRLIASDPDLPSKSFGQLTYKIDEKDVPFVIDSKTGLISVQKDAVLDHETQDVYTFHVTVADGGDGKGGDIKSKKVEVTVYVRDVNEKPELVKDDESNYPIEEKTVDHLVAKGTLINEWEFIDVDGSDDISNLELDIEHVNCDKNGCSAVDETGKVGLKDIFSLNTVSRMGDDGKNHMFVQLVVENPDKLNHEPIMKDWKDSAFTFVLSVTDDGDAKDTLIRKVTVRDVNETPAITDTREFTIAESVGENPATKVLPKLWVEGNPDYVLAHDSDRVEVHNGQYVYSIADNPYFAIDPVKGVITVKNGVKIDYEDPALEKVGDDKIYKVTVSVKDKGVGKLESSKEIIIHVTNENEGPELTDDGKTWIVDEHVQNHDFGSLIATDVDEGDEDNFTWSINMETAGAPADLFKINSMTGVVSVNGNLNDFEELWNKSIYNEKTHALEFKVSITVTDESLASSTLPKVISIRDVNETPVIADQKFIVKENTLAGDTVRPEGWKKGNPSNVSASENDEHSLPNGQFEYSIVGETPFKIDPITGVITVKADSTLNHEDPTLTGSTYPVTVKVKDKGNPADSATAVISIYIDDDNDKPIIVPDPKCDENKENCHKCDPEKEACTPVTPVTVCDATIEKCDEVCDASKQKCEPDPECKEGQCGYAVNKDTVYISVKENTGKDYKVLEYYVFDEDEADLKNMTVSFVDINGSGSKDLFKISESLVDGNKLVLTTATDIDYESVKDTHKILIIANDGQLADTIVRVIKIVDENEAPSAEDFNDSIPENPVKGYVVGTVKASDPDTKNPAYSTLSYKVVEDGVPFEMKGNKIVVKDPSALNYEKDSIFVFHVEVTDGATTPAISEVTIKLKDVGETPEIIEDDPTCDEKNPEDCHKCDAMIADCGKPSVPPADCVEKCGSVDKEGNIVLNVKENSPTGTVVLEYYVKDEDVGDLGSMKVSIKNDNKSGFDSLFVYDKKLVKDDVGYKLVVSVKDGSKLDYETVKELHKITITVTDKDDSTASIVRTIKVVDVNEPPFVVKKEFNFDEHNTKGSVVGTIEWGDDKDTKNSDFRDNKVVVVGGDVAVFDVDSVGKITTKKKFNYETDDTDYILVVKVVDRNEPDLFVLDTMKIHVNNVPEKPVITTTEFSIPENPEKKTVIGTIESEDLDDLDNKEERKYELLTPSSFVIVTEDGKIIVKDETKFDHEYTDFIKIDVKVTDPQGESTDTTIVIKITDENEAPSINDQTIHVSENAKIGSVVDTVRASDPDKDPKYSTLTYTVVGGDSAVFKVNPKTGVVTLKDSLDYEKKKEYKLKVEVFDGKFTETATVTIKVDNVVEKSFVDIIQVDNTDTTWKDPKVIYTNNPEGTITWVQDGDTLTADSTFHEGKNVIVITYKDPAKDEAGSDTVIVYFSTAAPEVTVTANGGADGAKNIYTIVEKTDAADSNIYVNSSKNDVLITVRDTVAHKDSTFVVKLELDTVKMDKKTLSGVTSVAKDGPVLNMNPSGSVTKTPVNGNEVSVSYYEKVNGRDSVKVTYKTDNKGEILLTPVIDAKGKVDSIEVITVSYVKVINGKEVVVSYQADAVTGEVLMTDSEGNLMTSAAAEAASSNSHVASSSSSSHKGEGSSSSKGEGSKLDAIKGGAGSFVVTYDYVDENGNTATISYVIDEEGNLVKNADGDIGYSVSYTYVNNYGNAATQSVFIVLDQEPPVVKISSPTYGQVVYSNYVTVVWSVNGVEQDTLNVQGLEEGTNVIVRFYCDKAGNEASDTVYVVMKDGKNVEIAIEQPVTEISREKVEEYYALNPPEEGQTYAVSIYNPSTGKEVETLKGGTFDQKKGSGEAPYPGASGHLGPTMSMDVRLPVVNDVGGMATLDDLVSEDGLIPLEGVDAENSEKVTVAEYVQKYCEDDVKATGDLSKVNLYKSKLDVKIWVYSSLGNFVDYFSFTQKLDDPDYTNEAGLLQMYFELKPDKNGDVRTESGRLYATGSYIYKVQADVRSDLKCTLPPVSTGKKKGDIIKNSDDLLKSFGYKRPKSK